MATATSSQATVINLLVQKFQALQLETPIGNQPVPIFDGPEGPNEEDNFVVVMGWPDDDSSGELTPAYLGSTASYYEKYKILVATFCYVGGDDNDAGYGDSDAQLTARTNANYIEAALESAVNADRNLAIQNGGVAPCIWCLPAGTSYSQAPPEEDSPMGRYARWNLTLDVYNVLT